MDKLQLFMRVYMYELEMYLNAHANEILAISFQSDEANTDRPLKEYLKRIILNECSCISDKVKEVTITDHTDESKKALIFPVTDEIRSFYIEQVLLPDEISDELKNLLAGRKNAVYTNPDICLKINANGIVHYETIELKSTKSNSIPGSSVQQIHPEEWVVFIKHTQKCAVVTTGMYLHAITAKMQFPDRSPRPQVSFSELENWNHQSRVCNEMTLHYQDDAEDSIRRDLLSDWQGVLAKRWTNILFTFNKSKKEPWFNNNLRKFILEFLKTYDKMDDSQKEEYKALILSLIE